jgi:SAM-dependent methyltransferase
MMTSAIGAARGPSIAVTVSAVAPPRRPTGAVDRWIAASIPPGATVLNIGAGSDLSGHLPRTRRRAAVLVGVDPSRKVLDNATLDQRFLTTVEEFAPEHPAEFDAAFSVFVLEHVTHPEAFAEATATVLHPGGALFGLTVNKWHYFGLTTWAASRLGISDWLLSRMRTEESVAAYHVRTTYRMNSIRRVFRLLDAAGFTAVEFRMWDLPSMYTPYLPARLKGVARGWHDLAYRWDRPGLMGHLSFKATR